jgi:putative addiction module killer protein
MTMIVKTLIDLEIYVKPSGSVPFVEWLESLKDNKIRFRIKERLDRLSLGNFGDHKHIAYGVYELRFKFGAGYRIYYGLHDEWDQVLLLTGGDKSSQKTDVKKAMKYWQDYFLR